MACRRHVFREDLLYRLNVITLRVPPLRWKRGRRTFRCWSITSLRTHAAGRKVKVTRAAMAEAHELRVAGQRPRKLENEVRRALVLGDGAIDLPEAARPRSRRGGPGARRGARGSDLRARVDALEAELVVEALNKTRGATTNARGAGARAARGSGCRK